MPHNHTLLALFVVAVASCASIETPPAHQPLTNCLTSGTGPPVRYGRWFDFRLLPELRPGDSTLDDVICAFGEPRLTFYGPHGEIDAIWSYSTPEDDGSVHIDFDSDRRMIHIVSTSH